MSEISQDTSHDVEGEICCLKCIYPHEHNTLNDDNFMAYKATSDPDTLYLHQAMKEPDKHNFIKAMEKEMEDQMKNGNFTKILRSKVSKGKTILPSVWQMKRKRDIMTRAITKYKARLNIDGSRMKKGLHYEETYAPVAKWNSIRILLTLALLHNWKTTQLDYVLAFPQAPVKKELYMEIPKGFEGASGDYVLQIHCNVYSP